MTEVELQDAVTLRGGRGDDGRGHGGCGGNEGGDSGRGQRDDEEEAGENTEVRTREKERIISSSVSRRSARINRHTRAAAAESARPQGIRSANRNSGI
ncbi:hypothetical protein GCM10018952_34930 [Streptosporangium vulgare]